MPVCIRFYSSDTAQILVDYLYSHIYGITDHPLRFYESYELKKHFYEMQVIVGGSCMEDQIPMVTWLTNWYGFIEHHMPTII